MFSPEVRGAFYVLALVGSCGMLGYFCKIKHILAKLLSFVMFVFAFNALTLLTGVIALVIDIASPPWHLWMRTINMILLALLPVSLYLGFWRWTNGRHRT